MQREKSNVLTPARAQGVKSENATLATRLSEAERELQAAKSQAAAALDSSHTASLEVSALRKQKDLLVQEVSKAVSAHRALHCAICKVQETHDGVGMLLRLSGDKCAIKQIIPGSPAAQCGQLQVIKALRRHRLARQLRPPPATTDDVRGALWVLRGFTPAVCWYGLYCLRDSRRLCRDLLFDFVHVCRWMMSSSQ